MVVLVDKMFWFFVSPFYFSCKDRKQDFPELLLEVLQLGGIITYYLYLQY